MVKPLSEQPLKHIETRTFVQNLLDEGKNLMAIAKNEIPFKPRHTEGTLQCNTTDRYHSKKKESRY